MAGAVIVVAIVLVVAGVGGSGSETVPSSTITQAAAATASAPGYRASVDGVMTTAAVPRPISVKGTGAIDTVHRRAAFVFRVSGTPGLPGGARTTKFEQVLDGLVMYMRAPIFKAATGGKEWVKFDMQRIQRAAGTAMPGDDLYSDPSQMVDQLRAVSGDVERVGRETVRGVRTTHYRATVDLRRYPKLAPPARRAQARRAVERLIDLTGESKMPQEVWIDGRRRIRRCKFDVEMKLANLPGRPTMRMQMTEDLFAFGTPVSIEVPSDDDAKDVTELGVRSLPAQ